MKIPIFPGKYHQNGEFSMAMLVYRRVKTNRSVGWSKLPRLIPETPQIDTWKAIKWGMWLPTPSKPQSIKGETILTLGDLIFPLLKKLESLNWCIFFAWMFKQDSHKGSFFMTNRNNALIISEQKTVKITSAILASTLIPPPKKWVPFKHLPMVASKSSFPAGSFRMVFPQKNPWLTRHQKPRTSLPSHDHRRKGCVAPRGGFSNKHVVPREEQMTIFGWKLPSKVHLYLCKLLQFLNLN